MGIRINTDGTMEDVHIPADAQGEHGDALNRVIGSRLFDVVGLPDGIDVFVDDEGLSLSTGFGPGVAGRIPVIVATPGPHQADRDTPCHR